MPVNLPSWKRPAKLQHQSTLLKQNASSLPSMAIPATTFLNANARTPYLQAMAHNRLLLKGQLTFFLDNKGKV